MWAVEARNLQRENDYYDNEIESVFVDDYDEFEIECPKCGNYITGGIVYGDEITCGTCKVNIFIVLRYQNE